MLKIIALYTPPSAMWLPTQYWFPFISKTEVIFSAKIKRCLSYENALPASSRMKHTYKKVGEGVVKLYVKKLNILCEKIYIKTRLSLKSNAEAKVVDECHNITNLVHSLMDLATGLAWSSPEWWSDMSHWICSSPFSLTKTFPFFSVTMTILGMAGKGWETGWDRL